MPSASVAGSAMLATVIIATTLFTLLFYPRMHTPCLSAYKTPQHKYLGARPQCHPFLTYKLPQILWASALVVLPWWSHPGSRPSSEPPRYLVGARYLWSVSTHPPCTLFSAWSWPMWMASMGLLALWLLIEFGQGGAQAGNEGGREAGRERGRVP